MLSLYAIALIVKSLRLRSSTSFAENSTLSGCLPSLYSPSILYVVTSYPVWFIITVTVPCFMPVSIVFLKNDFICSGLADVVISQSSGLRPSILSLTQPPTAYASYPLSSMVFIILLTSSGRLILISSILSLLISSNSNMQTAYMTAITL